MMVLAFAKFKNIFYILTKQLISSLHKDKRTSLKISVGFLKIFLLVLCAGCISPISFLLFLVFTSYVFAETVR